MVNVTNAQTTGKPDNKYVFLNNNFSVGYSLGLNKTEYALYEGIDLPGAPAGLLQELNFTYSFKLKNHFDISLKGGYGFFPFIYSLGEKNDPNNANFLPYFQRIQYSNYLSFTPMLNYNYWLKKKWILKAGIGFGIRTHSNEVAYNLGQIGGNWWSFFYVYGKRPKLYVPIEIGVERLLKNQNFIGLSAGYTYGIGETFYGNYEINQNGVISEGRMENAGHFASLNLKYTFTRAKKWAYVEDRFQKENTSFKEAKKSYKKERRAIDSKSIFIGFSAGWTSLLNSVQDDPYIKTSYHWSSRAGVSGEIGLQSNRFLDFGVHFGGYSSGYKVGGDAFKVDASSSFLQVLELNGGYGVRLFNKKGFNFFDVSAGLQLGMHTLSNDILSFYNEYIQEIGSTFNGIPNDDLTIHILPKESVKNNFFPLIYLKTARNFRIKNYLYFSMAAQYNLGFYPITTKELSYSVSTTPLPIENDVIVKLNGTGLQILFGLKYRFVPKKKSE
ncbi:MAG: hypothetical protein GQ574_10225 [Crocinitomix sp.]|nr:hypothetical protein [Crocinitomix sp.]